MKRSVLLLAFAAVLITVPVSAAGQSFASRANAICERYYKKLNAISPPSAKTPKAVAAYEKRVLPLGVAELATFKRMTPPASLKASYTAWLKVTVQEVSIVKRSIAAGEANNASLVNKLLAQGAALDKRYNALADKMGMNVCGQPTSKTK